MKITQLEYKRTYPMGQYNDFRELKATATLSEGEDGNEAMRELISTVDAAISDREAFEAVPTRQHVNLAKAPVAAPAKVEEPKIDVAKAPEAQENTEAPAEKKRGRKAKGDQQELPVEAPAAAATPVETPVVAKPEPTPEVKAEEAKPAEAPKAPKEEKKRGVIYTRSLEEHKALLSSICSDLKEGWALDTPVLKKIGALSRELDGNAIVINPDGEINEDFKAKCREILFAQN